MLMTGLNVPDCHGAALSHTEAYSSTFDLDYKPLFTHSSEPKLAARLPLSCSISAPPPPAYHQLMTTSRTSEGEVQ